MAYKTKQEIKIIWKFFPFSLDVKPFESPRNVIEMKSLMSQSD